MSIEHGVSIKGVWSQGTGNRNAPMAEKRADYLPEVGDDKALDHEVIARWRPPDV